MAIKELPDGRFEADIQRRGVKRKRVVFDSRREAEAFERQYLAEFAGSGAVGDKRKLSDLIELWDRYHGINLADHDKRLRALEAICAGLGNPVAERLTPEDFVDFRYQRTVRNPPERRITPKTFNNHHTYLRAVYSQLRKLKVIEYECPIAEVDFIKVQERQLSYLSKDQIGLLMDTIASCCTNESTYWVAQLCLRTGARWGEAEGLKRKQLHGGRVTFEFTKSKKTRTVPLDDGFFSELLKFAGGKSPETRVFVNCIGSFRRAVRRAGLDLPTGQCTHILRHSFASHFMMSGGNILTLQKILGHSDIKMTMTYAHLAPEHLKDAIRLNPMA